MKRTFICLVCLLAFSTYTHCAREKMQVSKKMQGFMAEFQKSGSIQKASKSYGYQDSSSLPELGELDYVILQFIDRMETDTCYSLKFKARSNKEEIRVCWSEGRISRIENR